MAGSLYSVTLTGRIRAGGDPPAVWARVARRLQLDPEAFRSRVLERLPVTLKAVDYEQARRQQEALSSSGADVCLLAESVAPRVWVHVDHATRGPLSMDYARHALHAGDLPGATRACLQGSGDWQALENLLGVGTPRPTKRPLPDREAAVRPARRPPLPGWVLALLVVAASVGLVGTLAVLVGAPAWRARAIRSQLVQGRRLAAPARAAVARYLQQQGRLPVDNAEAGLAAATTLGDPPVQSVTVDHGRVIVQFGAGAGYRLRRRRLRFVPLVRGDRVTWTCTPPHLPHGDLPSWCR